MLIATCASKQQKRSFYSWIGSLSLLQARNNCFHNKQQISGRFFSKQALEFSLTATSSNFSASQCLKTQTHSTLCLISQYFSWFLFGLDQDILRNAGEPSAQGQRVLTTVPDTAHKHILNGLWQHWELEHCLQKITLFFQLLSQPFPLVAEKHQS